MEQDLLDRGIQPATMNWPERSRTWFYGHEGSLDPLTGDCIYGSNIQRAAQRLQRTQEQDFVTFLKESNLTAAQITGGQEIPKAEVVVKWTFELGKSLVPPK